MICIEQITIGQKSVKNGMGLLINFFYNRWAILDRGSFDQQGTIFLHDLYTTNHVKNSSLSVKNGFGQKN